MARLRAYGMWYSSGQRTAARLTRQTPAVSRTLRKTRVPNGAEKCRLAVSAWVGASYCGLDWSLVPARSHKPSYAGSNPAPATKKAGIVGSNPTLRASALGWANGQATCRKLALRACPKEPCHWAGSHPVNLANYSLTRPIHTCYPDPARLNRIGELSVRPPFHNHSRMSEAASRLTRAIGYVDALKSASEADAWEPWNLEGEAFSRSLGVHRRSAKTANPGGDQFSTARTAQNGMCGVFRGSAPSETEGSIRDEGQSWCEQSGSHHPKPGNEAVSELLTYPSP